MSVTQGIQLQCECTIDCFVARALGQPPRLKRNGNLPVPLHTLSHMAADSDCGRPRPVETLA